MTGEIASILIIAARLVLPLSIFKFPLAGIFLSIAADASDVMTFEATGWGYFRPDLYHQLDKLFDVYYLAIAYLVSRNWNDVLSRNTAVALFFWRVFGALAFEFTGYRVFFVFAPNIFENFYILRLIVLKIQPSFVFDKKTMFAALTIAGIPKLVQEYFMHYLFVDQTWGFIRDNFLWWLYAGGKK